jgi:hypothetical protein
LWIVLPNNQRWVYKWIFESVIPDLLGRYFCSRVKVIIADGDWNEMASIDDYLLSIFMQAIRI